MGKMNAGLAAYLANKKGGSKTAPKGKATGKKSMATKGKKCPTCGQMM